MKLSKSILPGLGFLFVCLVAGYIALEWLDVAHYSFWNGVPDNLKGPGDIYSYVVIMRAFREGDFSNFFLHYWAPGFPLIAALITSLTGEAHYFAKIYFTVIAFWTVSLTCIYHWISFPKNPWVKFVAIASIWFLPNFRGWSLGYGYLLSESISHAIVLAGFALLAKGILEGAPRRIYAAAVILGVAANFRAVLDFSFSFASYMMIGAFAVYLTYCWIGRQPAERPLNLYQYFRSSFTRSPPSKDRASFKVFVISFLILNSLTMPWKTVNLIHCKHYAFSCGGTSLEWTGFHWANSNQYDDFVRAGNPACMSDPKLCEIVQANRPKIDKWLLPLSIMTLIRHPLNWAAFKLQNFNWIWVGLPWGAWGEHAMFWFEGLLYLVAGSVGLILLVRPNQSISKDRRTRARALALVAAALIVAYCGIFAMLHYEDRYSLTLRLFFLILLSSGLTMTRPAVSASSSS